MAMYLSTKDLSTKLNFVPWCWSSIHAVWVTFWCSKGPSPHCPGHIYGPLRLEVKINCSHPRRVQELTQYFQSLCGWPEHFYDTCSVISWLNQAQTQMSNLSSTCTPSPGTCLKSIEQCVWTYFHPHWFVEHQDAHPRMIILASSRSSSMIWINTETLTHSWADLGTRFFLAELFTFFLGLFSTPSLTRL